MSKGLNISICTLLLILSFISSEISANEFRVGTWNIAWLGDGVNDTLPRTADDLKRLQKYVDKLSADVVALQEMENEIAFHSIFDKSEWEVFLSSRNSKQRTGLAVRKGFLDTVNIQQQADYEALHTSYALRYGTDIKITYPDNTTIRLLSIHLKSGCFDETDLSEDSKQGWDTTACQKLGRQIQPLKNWIVARIAEGVPFIVVGDWNRRMNMNGDVFWTELTNGLDGKLHRAGGVDRKALCNSRFPNPIDHIVIGGGLKEITDSFREITYSEVLEQKKQISDHCPISVEIKVS
ncbi:MAG: endonuclease/exonuclease/phosphatase family protein [Aestuariivita sp.]|nr:endonuclease/exonuclease/phosphatase family protein [Aestuariivita sp.]